MFQIFFNLFKPGADRRGPNCIERWSQWLRDPLSHPELQAMSATQLADLPFDPGRVARD